MTRNDLQTLADAICNARREMVALAFPDAEAREAVLDVVRKRIAIELIADNPRDLEVFMDRTRG